MSAKEIRYFNKVSQGIKDGKLLNISTGREIDEKGATAKKLTAKDLQYKIAANTQNELDDFIEKYKAHTAGAPVVARPPSPRRKAPTPPPSPRRKKPTPTPSPRKTPPPSPTFVIRKKTVARKPSPRKTPSPPTTPTQKTPPKVTKPVVVAHPKLPGYANPKRCGPKNAYVCPDDLICNVDSNNCVTRLVGKKKIETIINQLDKEIKIGGTTEGLQKAMESIKKEVQKSREALATEPAPTVTVVDVTKEVLPVRRPRKIATPQEKEARKGPPKELAGDVIRELEKIRETTPPPIDEISPIRPTPLVPAKISPQRRPVTPKEDTMTALVTELSKIDRPAVGEATKKRGRPREESPIPARPVIPEIQTLSQRLNNERTRNQIRNCLGIPF